MSKLLVYEREPSNAAPLARAAGLALSEVRSLSQLREAALVTSCAALCVQIQLEELTDILSIVREAKERGSSSGTSSGLGCGQVPAVIGLPEASVRPHAAILYEAGVDMLFWSMLDRDRAVGLIRRAAAMCDSNVAPELSWKSQIADRLPWKRHASGGGRVAKKGNNGET